MSKTLCFCLGSGGSRGVAHIGFLQAMEDNGIKPNFIVGCSIGSVVGACYSYGYTPKQMKEICDSLNTFDLIDLSLLPITKKSLLKSVKLQKVLKNLLKDKTFEDLSIPFKCVATDIVSGKAVTLESGDLEECVRASSSIPVVFRPVLMGDMELVDGGVVERLPIRVCKDFNPEVIVAVDVLGDLKKYEKSKNIVSQSLRTIDVNDNILTSYYLEKYKPDLLIKPKLNNMSQYKVKNLNRAYELGYVAGEQNVEKIKKLIK